MAHLFEAAAAAMSNASGSTSGVTPAPPHRHQLGEKGHKAEDDIGSDLVFALMVIVGTGTFFYHHLKVFRIPYTVIMFLYGGLLGGLSLLWPATFDAYFGLLSSVDPELLFHIFLPILIFEGSYGMKIHAFREVVGQVIILAGPGVAINTLLMSAVIKYVLYPEWNWFLILLVASLLSATDPVSVVALLKDLGVDKRLTALVDGEAIMNDGTAIICFTLFLPASRTGIFHMNAGETILMSCQLLFVGIIFGCFCGWLQARALHFCHNEPIVETFITVAFAFISFFVADEFLKTSGVLTLCVQGVYLSSRYPSMFPGKHGSMFNTVWHFLVHFANTIIFSMVGIIIVREGLSEFEIDDLWKLLVLYLTMVSARLLMIFMLLPCLNVPFTYKLTIKECLLLTHSGLRGAVAMTLALIVAKDSGVDAVSGDRVLFHTSGIVILTTVVNATTSSMAVKKLGHKRKDANRLLQMKRAHQYMLDAGFEALDRVNTDVKYTMGNYRMMHTVLDGMAEDPYTGLPGTKESEDSVVNRLVMRAFKTNVWTQRDAASITEKVVRVLARLSARCLRLGVLIESSDLLVVQELPWHLKLFDCVGPAKISHKFKVGREQMFYGMLLAYDNALHQLEKTLPIYLADSPKQMRRVHHWLQEERQQVTKLTHDFSVAKPESATSVVTSKGAEYVIRCMQEAVHELNHSKGLSLPETEALEVALGDQRAIVDRWDIEVPQPSTESIIAGSTLCVNVAEETIHSLIHKGTLRNFQPDQLVVYEPDSFGIVVRGSVDWLGRDGWAAGSQGLINIEGFLGFTKVFETALTAVSTATILFVPFELARTLGKKDPAWEESVDFQAACHIGRHLLSEHHKYAELPLSTLLTRCQRSGRLLVASSDHYQPTVSVGETVCFLGGGSDMDGVFLPKRGKESEPMKRSESPITRVRERSVSHVMVGGIAPLTPSEFSEPMLLPRALRLSYTTGAKFLAVGGTVEKAMTAAKKRRNTLTKKGDAYSSAATVPVFGLPNVQESDQQMAEELDSLNAPNNELSVGLNSDEETSASQRINVSSATYSVEKYRTSIPLVNRYHLKFHVLVEGLSDCAEDYAEFLDSASRTAVLKTTDLVLQQLTSWCIDFFQTQEMLGKQNAVPLPEEHRAQHAEFFERVRVWSHGRRKGEMVHQSMLTHMASFSSKHFPEDKIQCAALVKAAPQLSTQEQDLPFQLPAISRSNSGDNSSLLSGSNGLPSRQRSTTSAGQPENNLHAQREGELDFGATK